MILGVSNPKQCCSCELLHTAPISEENEKSEKIIRLTFRWTGPSPRAGQFFMIRPERTSVFLGRPISAAGWETGQTVSLVIAKRGTGTKELAGMKPGEQAELIGPLGNAWGDMLSGEGPIALAGGGLGIAPLTAFAGELEPERYDFYAGFRSASFGLEGLQPRSLIVASEDGSTGRQGRIPDFLEPALYRAVYACGPEPMLKAVTAACKRAGVPCFISMERRMACGTGACLGCTIQTISGNRRCCADGPIFKAEEVIFESGSV